MRAAFVDANASLAEVMRCPHRPGDLPVTIHEDPDITPEDLPRLLKGVPIAISKLPGFSTWPETAKILVPPALATPRLANHSPPLRMIEGTEENDSVLLIVVGRPYRP